MCCPERLCPGIGVGVQEVSDLHGGFGVLCQNARRQRPRCRPCKAGALGVTRPTQHPYQLSWRSRLAAMIGGRQAFAGQWPHSASGRTRATASGGALQLVSSAQSAQVAALHGMRTVASISTALACFSTALRSMHASGTRTDPEESLTSTCMLPSLTPACRTFYRRLVASTGRRSIRPCPFRGDTTALACRDQGEQNPFLRSLITCDGTRGDDTCERSGPPGAERIQIE